MATKVARLQQEKQRVLACRTFSLYVNTSADDYDPLNLPNGETWLKAYKLVEDLSDNDEYTEVLTLSRINTRSFILVTRYFTKDKDVDEDTLAVALKRKNTTIYHGIDGTSDKEVAGEGDSEV